MSEKTVPAGPAESAGSGGSAGAGGAGVALPRTPLLSSIARPSDLDRLTSEDLVALAGEIRRYLVATVARTGGHLGPNLGVVELTLALHRTFRSPRDTIVFDTGHQAYVHKLLTGRQDFAHLRERGGVSGYPARSESVHDVVENSHASTSLSWADGIARANRLLIAERMLARWNAEGACLLDVHHNFLQPVRLDGEAGWLHRKGATPSDCGLVLIPGSRGDYSYLVLPTQDCQISLNTLAHGAGRKWQRGECKGRLSHKYSADSLRRTAFGSVVVCADKALIFEEAPQAYKNIDSIIEAMQNAGLIELVARFKPVLTYKTSGGCGE